MKRFLALFLALVMIFGMIPALGIVAKAEATATTEVSAKPFYGLAWDTVDMSMFGNIEDPPVIRVTTSDDVVSLKDADPETIKKTLDALPEGMRYILITNTRGALAAGAELVVYADNGVAQLKKLMTDFVEDYYALGGQLDGIIIDTEYTAMGSWYLYGDPYGGHYASSAPEGSNRNFYHDVVAHPKYATDIRPLLEAHGFVFYEEIGGDRSEIWSMYPPQTIRNVMKNEPEKMAAHFAKYGNCYSIWNRVMNNRIAAYMTDAIYNPMAARYPNATLSDYRVADTATWENYISHDGSTSAMIGNTDKVGNTSNENMYNAGPSSSFFVEDGVYQYNNIQSHNAAIYDDDAYSSLMFYVNRFKGIYAATDTKKISTWVAEYDYNGRDNSVKNSPYYTEYLYHVGLLDPLPFQVYIYRTGAEEGDKFYGTEGKIRYNQCIQVISQALNELTRVAGYSDRKPIETPQSWNDGFLLSGMYANGRNIWRLTPDTTDGKTLEDFKVAGTNPTFSINGNTITFPGGKILTDSTINIVGSCGYWIETAADVQPVITREADRYAKNPSYLESFTYDDGTAFNSDNAKDVQAWEASSELLIESGALALTGTATLDNVKLPKNITAGDSYAMKQAWELSFTLSEALTAGSATFFNGMVKLESSNIYYNANGSYEVLAAISAGTKYTINVNNNFTANTATYTLSAGGAVVAQAENVTVAAVTLPVSTISMAASGVTAKVLVDDYKLYPTGLEYTLKCYDGDTGIIQSATEQLTNDKVAFRLSWMNATSGEAKGQICVDRHDGKGIEVLKTIDMKSGWDGVETGVLENTTGKLTVSLKVCEKANTTLERVVEAGCTTEGYTGDLVCNDCGEIYERGSVIAAGSHKTKTLTGKSATCTAEGLTSGKQCTVCGLITVAQEVIPAKGHTLVTYSGQAATCTTAGKTDLIKCAVCTYVEQAREVIPALGHSYDDALDTDCNECGETRTVEVAVIVTADNYLQLVDTNANHIYHRVIPYFLGDQTVEDITDEDALKTIDPNAQTRWGASQINSKRLTETGNYVLVLHYNDTELNGKKITTYTEVSVVVPELTLPQIAVQDHTLVATEGDASIVNYRAVVYYLGNKTVSDIYNRNILKAMDPGAKTYWGLSSINKARLWESGNYVIHLNYNVGKGVKQTVAVAFTNEFSEITIDVVAGKLVAADPDNAYIYHRAVVYYVGDELVDPDNEKEVQAAAITTATYWGLEDINKVKLTKPGNYVVVLHYNLPNSPKMSIAIDACI